MIALSSMYGLGLHAMFTLPPSFPPKQDANRDRLLVAYDTSEGWRCRAEVHRFHVISAGRHQVR